MRAAIFVVMLAGCGRFGFGEIDRTDATMSIDGTIIDAPEGVGASPEFCDDRMVTTLVLAGTDDPVAIRAVALTTGYAVAIETTAQEIQLLELDTTGALVGTHVPFTPGYSPLYGIAELGDRPIVGLETGSREYLKLVDPGWEAYTTGPSGEPAVIDPPLGTFPGETSALVGQLDASFNLNLGRMSADGQTLDVTDYVPAPAIAASFAGTPTGARVVIEQPGGTCETFVVTPQGVTGARHSFSPCYAPKLAALDDMGGVILHRIDAIGPYAVHTIPAVATDAGTTFTLQGATYARIVARDGAYWIGHGSGSYRGITRIENGVATEHRDMTPAFFFDLTTRDAFWIEGPAVHVSTPCLR